MAYVKNTRATSALLLLVMLTVPGCGTTPKQPQPSLVIPEAVIPKLSAELKKQPLPSGSYWASVTQWRKTWDETLKALPPRSER